jgi:hypothetical protein
MRPFWEIPLVTEWAQQYKHDSPNSGYGVQARFKFLVLTGPSCFGKTQFAKAIFGAQNTLLIQRQSVSSPGLKEYRLWSAQMRRLRRVPQFDRHSKQNVVPS